MTREGAGVLIQGTGMKDNHPLEDSHRYLRLALPLMSRHDIPVTPRNFTVWYRYVAGGDRELSKAIDTMRRKGERFSEEKNEALYNRFCAELDEDELKTIRAELQQILTTLLTEVKELTGQTKEYESFVSTSVSKLSEDASIGDIRRVVNEIKDKTKTLGRFGKTVQHQLNETTVALTELKKDFEQVKTEALADFLTGVPNRKAFDETLVTLGSQAQRDGTDLSLLLIDIDRFKQFNDGYGHLIGDAVLKFVAKTAKEIVRGRDFLARFGGEEFVVILPQTPLSGAVVVAENIRKFFAQTSLQVVVTSRNIGVITVSIGAAVYRPGEPLEELLNRADRALYHAKKTGRNRVTTEADVDAETSIAPAP
jgi:diguanylate cyclase